MKTDSKGRTINTFFNRAKDTERDPYMTDTDNYPDVKVHDRKDINVDRKEVKLEKEIVIGKNLGDCPLNEEVANSSENYLQELEIEASIDNEIEDVEIENDDEQSTVDTVKKIGEESQTSNEVEMHHQTEPDPKDITTITKEIDRLNEELQAVHQQLEESIVEKDKNEKLYLELKDVLVKIGLTRELNILDDIKAELKNEQDKNLFLSGALKEKEQFIESLQKGIFSGINQLFDQKPPNQIIGKIESSSQLGMIEANKYKSESVRDIKTKEEMIKEILKLNIDGKNLTEIAEITKLSKQKVNSVLKEYGKNEEKGA